MTEGERPLLRVVRGDPTPEELAALVTAVAAVSANADDRRRARPRSAWADPARLHRRPLAHGPDGWRRHGLPG